ncbi:MAG TPA: S8 family serine peptidase [Acidimicrobiia bacterium]|nr:S8 family serine peptidase [Acidimicrobiia bacterium]
MTRSLLVVLTVLLLTASGVPSIAARQATPTMGQAAVDDLSHARDHVLVKLSPGHHRGLSDAGVAIHERWRTHPVPPGRTPIETVEALLKQPGVETAELDYEFQIAPQPEVSALDLTDLAAPNDPYLSNQWHLPAIQAIDAWSVSSGSGVVVAVVDSGVSLGGEDLDCHTFVFPYNAITGTTGVSAVEDDNGHGTHVTGTVAQCTNNGVGVAGVAFNASLMPIKALNGGLGFASDVARGVDWARSRGANVINLSLGGSFKSPMLDEAIEAAADAGIVVVAAAGNDGGGSVLYPANHPDVIAVGATDPNNQRAFFSNTGSDLDLVAPGVCVLQETFDQSGNNGCPSPIPVSNGWGYYFLNGTSMAAPHVSAAAALLLAVEPSLNPDSVRNALVKTALDLGAPGFDNAYGHGLIQVHKALGFDLVRPTWPGDAELTVTRFGETSLTLSWSAASDDVGVTGYLVREAGTPGSTTTSRQTTVTGLQSGSQYVFEVLARDKAGNWSDPLKATVRTARAFSDTPGHTFYNDILWMSGMDITRGCNPPVNDLFCPDDPVTRGQMAAFIVRALGLKANTHPSFDDVSSENTFHADIGKLATAGITKGCNPPANNLYCPDDPVTRAQMSAFVVRALGLKANTHPGFVDVPSSHTFHADIGKLATAGITRGCNPPANDRFCPDEPITRGQLAAFFHRALD